MTHVSVFYDIVCAEMRAFGIVPPRRCVVTQLVEKLQLHPTELTLTILFLERVLRNLKSTARGDAVVACGLFAKKIANDDCFQLADIGNAKRLFQIECSYFAACDHCVVQQKEFHMYSCHFLDMLSVRMRVSRGVVMIQRRWRAYR